MEDSTISEALVEAAAELARNLSPLQFGAPVAATYHVTEYASEPHFEYLRRYGPGRGKIFFLGMNPGPFGMVQTGIPFGAVPAVRDWMRITGIIRQPALVHPKRPVNGFECTRVEVSGARLWGYFSSHFPRAEDFFSRALVYNYCPLAFMNTDGANLIPEKLQRREREALYALCDQHLRTVLELLQPRILVGVGVFAHQCLQRCAGQVSVPIYTIPHPSPANPGANRSWAADTQSILGAKDIGLIPLG